MRTSFRAGRSVWSGLAVWLALWGAGQAQPAKQRPAPTPTSEAPAKQAAAFFEAGQSAHARGELEKAIEAYTEAIRLDPSLWQAGFQRGAANLSLRRYGAARESIQQVLEQLKEFADSPELREIGARVQVMAGEIALAEKKPEEGVQAFRRALDLNPKAARAHAGLAEAFLAEGKPAEAMAEARAAREAGDDRPETLALLGEALTAAKQYDEALSVLTEVIRREPGNAVAYRYRAEIALAKKQPDAAVEDLRKALEIDARIDTQIRLAEVYGQQLKIEDALAMYERVLQAEPGNEAARRARAALQVSFGKPEDAIPRLEELLKAEPGRADLHGQLASLLLPTAPDRALQEYSQAAKLDPRQPQYQIGVGSALVKLRRFEEAVPALRQVLAGGPKEEVAYFAHTNLGTAFFELKDYQNAAREFIWILGQQQRLGDPKKAAITLYFLGICFDRLGDYEQALKAYQQFLSLATAENQLEIDKVKLRLPSLERQLKEGKGKRKP